MENQRRNVEIKSAHLKNDQQLSGSYVEKMGELGANTHKINNTVPVHKDLRIAIKKLARHAIKLAEVYDADGLVNESKIDVIGFTISGEDNAEGVSIFFARILSNAKEIVMNTPFQKWDDPASPYEEASELSLIIEECKAEVYSYLFDAKHQSTNQLGLFDTPVTEENPDRDLI